MSGLFIKNKFVYLRTYLLIVLKELSKKDKLWRRFAYKICKNRMLADDLTQQMYLKFHDYFSKPNATQREIKDTYIYVSILNLFKTHIKKNQNISIDTLHFLECPNHTFYADDEQQRMLDAYEKLDWKQRELLELIQDMSYREIEKEHPMINYMYAFTQVKKAREIILDR